MSQTTLRENRQGNLWLSMLYIVAMTLMTLAGNAQTAGTGSIQGVVTDGTGAVIPNATVIATNTATQVKQTTTTGGSGLYSFPNIAIGTYNVDVAALGFEHYRQEHSHEDRRSGNNSSGLLSRSGPPDRRQ